MRDPRLILAIEADNLNAMAIEFGQFMTVKQIAELDESHALEGATDFEAICSFLTDQGVWFGPRRELEEIVDFRQLIPYVLLKYEDKFLVYQRGDEIEEARLRGNVALGWGGHIDLPDAVCTESGTVHLADTVAKAVAREILEEVGIVTKIGLMDIMGLVVSNDPVGRVHVGMVLVLEVAGQVASLEESQTNLRYMSIEELEQLDTAQQEGWTSVIVPYLKDYVASAKPEQEEVLVKLPGQD